MDLEARPDAGRRESSGGEPAPFRLPALEDFDAERADALRLERFLDERGRREAALREWEATEF